MNDSLDSNRDVATLSALAGGIIPADERDAGAAAVGAGPTIAARMHGSPHANVYVEGLIAARQIAESAYGCDVSRLSGSQLHELLAILSERSPAFFRQLRADVCALYLSDADVWKQIGFPGPSTEQGGYLDFDQPQR